MSNNNKKFTSVAREINKYVESQNQLKVQKKFYEKKFE